MSCCSRLRRSLFTGALTLVASASAVLAAPMQWGSFSYEDKGTTVEIVGLVPYFTGHLQIPATISGKPVTRIGAGAFKHQSRITRVTIPPYVTEIAPEAFARCSSLVDVTASSGNLVKIFAEAFRGCSYLETVQLPLSLRVVDSLAFADCYTLVDITVPAASDDIQPSAFSGCGSLLRIHVAGAGTSYTSVDGVLFKGKTLVRFPEGRTGSYAMPASVTRVGSGAFMGSGLGKVDFSPKVTTLDDGAFSSCLKLVSVALPASLVTIADGAFRNSGLKGTVQIPTKVTAIGYGAFAGCLQLARIEVASENTAYSSRAGCLYDKSGKLLVAAPHGMSELVVPSGTLKIGVGAFEYHKNLKRISFPGSLTEIEDEAFYGCDALTKVFIPASVTRIGYAAFYTYAIEEIHFGGNAPDADLAAFASFSDPLVYAYAGAQGFTFPYWRSMDSVSVTDAPFPAADIEIKTAAGQELSDGAATVKLASAILGKTSTTTLQVANRGTGTLWGFSVSKSGSHPDDFTLVPSGPLEPAQSATWKLSFKPSAAGARTATFRITSNDPDEAPFDLNVSASATSAPEIVVQQPKGSSLVDGVAKKSFGTARVGSKGRVLTFVIKNTGTKTLSGLALASAGKHAGDFQTSALAKKSLAPGASLTFKVTFAPKAKGNRSTTLRITSNDRDESPFDIKLAGSGAK